MRWYGRGQRSKREFGFAPPKIARSDLLLKHVNKLEDKYYKNDPLIKEKTDEVIVNFGNYSESEDDLFSESD